MMRVSRRAFLASLVLAPLWGCAGTTGVDADETIQSSFFCFDTAGVFGLTGARSALGMCRPHGRGCR